MSSVFTPYYSETVLYSSTELREENEDGISILFYLQKIFPGKISLENLYFDIAMTIAVVVLVINFNAAFS